MKSDFLQFPEFYGGIIIPGAVAAELEIGIARSVDVPSYPITRGFRFASLRRYWAPCQRTFIEEKLPC